MNVTSTTCAELKRRINKCDTAFYEKNVAPRIRNFYNELENEISAAAFSGRRVIGLFDFDADGIMSALEAKRLYPDIEVHIGDRYIDGYGLPNDLSFLQKNDVVILGDIGSADPAGIRLIRNITGSLPFIVDHHELPLQKEEWMETYPRMLNFYQNSPEHIPGYCTAGLFFQLAKLKHDAGELSDEDYALVSMYNAFGSIADESPMNSRYDTTREDVKFGFLSIENVSLERINPAFGYFLSKTGLYDEEYMHTSAAQFKVNPVLNAPGRIGKKVELGVSGGQFLYDTLSSTTDIVKLKDRIDLCIAFNDKRKAMEAAALEDPSFLNAVKNAAVNKSGICICYIPSLDPGICGRIAQKLVEATGVPSICLCGDRNDLRGSARNAAGYPEMLSICGKILLASGMQCGGHEDAFGLTGTYAAMSKASTDLYLAYKKIKPKEVEEIEAITKLSDVTVPKLLTLEPHGRDYPLPLVAVEDKVAQVKEFARGYGDIRVSSAKDVKFFGQNLDARKGEKVFIMGDADISTFMNKTSVQVNVRSVTPKDREKVAPEEEEEEDMEK